MNKVRNVCIKIYKKKYNQVRLVLAVVGSTKLSYNLDATSK